MFHKCFINASKTHFVRDIRVSHCQGKFSAEISATIMSSIYHRDITVHFLLFDVALSLSRYPDNLSVRRILIGKLSNATAIMAPGNVDAMSVKKKSKENLRWQKPESVCRQENAFTFSTS